MTKNLFLKTVIDILIIVCISVAVTVLINLLLSTLGLFLSGSDFMNIARSPGMVVISFIVFMVTFIGGFVAMIDK